MFTTGVKCFSHPFKILHTVQNNNLSDNYQDSLEDLCSACSNRTIHFVQFSTHIYTGSLHYLELWYQRIIKYLLSTAGLKKKSTIKFLKDVILNYRIIGEARLNAQGHNFCRKSRTVLIWEKTMLQQDSLLITVQMCCAIADNGY